jgi:hypothetical protein
MSADFRTGARTMAAMRNPLTSTWRALFKRPAPPAEYRSTLPPYKPPHRRRKTDKWKS